MLEYGYYNVNGQKGNNRISGETARYDEWGKMVLKIVSFVLAVVCLICYFAFSISEKDFKKNWYLLMFFATQMLIFLK